MGQVGFHRTVPLVLYETGGIGWTHRTEVLVGQVGFHRTVPLVLYETGGIGWTHRTEVLVGQVGFHWTVLCILNQMCGISSNRPTCLCGTGDYLEWTRNFDGKLGHKCHFRRHSLFFLRQYMKNNVSHLLVKL